jgi:primosomal protein N'
VKQFLTQLADSLNKELTQLKTVRREIRLFSGERLGAFAGYTYYRFEIPEDVLFHTTERATFAFGQQQIIKVTGNIIAIENQYLTVALPQDFGESLPETLCSWDHEHELKQIINLLQNLDGKSLIPFLLFNPADGKNNHIVNYEVQKTDKASPDQIEAIKKIWQNRVTMLWGPSLSGITQVLILAAINYIKAGRKVLYVSPSNDDVDTLLLKTVTVGEQSLQHALIFRHRNHSKRLLNIHLSIR